MEAGHSVVEVEAAGNTPLHNAAYEGWQEGVELLLSLGAKVNASNNAGLYGLSFPFSDKQLVMPGFIPRHYFFYVQRLI